MTLEAAGLERRYGDRVALAGLTLTVGAGEVVGLLGPNGAGKTTAIRVLTTILEPTAGRFAVAGIGHERPSEIRRRIGVLPESAGYPAHQTGTEFLRYHAELFGLPRASARARAGALLVEVGLDERGSFPIATYSRGMRQRLGIARALVNEPAVVFFDEPTLGLDPAGQRQVLGIVAGIARERDATVILSTHFLAEVEEICSRVLILHHGRPIAQGTVAEVTSRAAAPRRGRFKVSAELREPAQRALATAGGVSDVRPLDSRAEWLTGAVEEGAVARAADALDRARIPLLAFELEGARLSDAFLTMTERG